MSKTLNLTQPAWAHDRIVVGFPFDPALVRLLQSIPGRSWDKSRSVWTIPCTPEAVDKLANGAQAMDVRLMAERSLMLEVAERREALSSAAVIKQHGDAAIPWPLVTTPYAHQRASLAFLHALGGGALLHEMGTGKSACAIAYAETLPANRVLVITPNTVKRNWLAEIEKQTGEPNLAVAPEGTTANRGYEIMHTAKRYVIVNSEALSLPATAKAMQAVAWDLVIVDESTRFKTASAKRTKALHKLRAKHRIILTGSPITGKPEDAWAQFEFVSPGIFGSWWSFSDRFLLKDHWNTVVGVKPEYLNDLRSRIDARSYRVLKADVLDLPPKVYENREVELSGEQAAAYKQMRDDLQVKMDEMPSVSATIVLTQLLRLTQITAGLIGEGDKYRWLDSSAKLTELDALLNDELSGEQVVIFGVYQRELEHLAKRYTDPLDTTPFGTKYHPPIVYGPTPEQVRHSLVNEFQAGRRRLLFAQMHSGGIGINLTAAQTVVFYTRSWSAEDYWQAQDRLHRIGQKGTVTIINLVAKGTVDMQIAKALEAKSNLADRLTGDDLRKLAREVLK